MFKKLFALLSACMLAALVTACEKSVPDGGDIGKPQEPVVEEDDHVLPTAFLSASETVANMGAGWNLGNTLEAHSGDTTNMWIERWTDGTPADYESAWGQVPVTRELIHMIHEAGFRSVRVPVTWYPHMGTRFNIVGYSTIWFPSMNPIGDKVDKVWMDRVREVVDYVLEEDMYCIINVHHDTGTANTHWFVASEENHARNSSSFKNLWTQIAETFRDYDGRLLFEGYNEMTDEADSWCFASYNTPARYDAAMASRAYAAVNAYAQDFVDAVRATGGNNTERNLIVNTYAACCGDGNWNSHLNDPLDEMKLPDDISNGHLAFQVHYYPSFSSVTEGKAGVDKLVSSLKRYLVDKGAPVIVGEWAGSGDSPINYDKRRQDYFSFIRYFMQETREAGMATFYWMGISDGEDRAVPKLTQPDLAEVIVECR